MKQNAFWNIDDVDYTPYKNIISAVWPTLRHRDYTYAILNARSVDVAAYYRQTGSLSLTDPCTHVDHMRCGTTGIYCFFLEANFYHKMLLTLNLMLYLLLRSHIPKIP